MGSTATPQTPLLANFAARQRTLAAEGPDWLRGMRSDGLARYGRMGLPTTKLEDWRGTNLAEATSSGLVGGLREKHAGLRRQVEANPRSLGWDQIGDLFHPELSGPARSPLACGGGPGSGLSRSR